MKKLICTMTLAALLCGAAGAAGAPYSAQARLRPDVPVRIGGIVQTFYDAQGNEVHPLNYGGTTYVPIRAVGELMGKNVNWDAANLTATIGGERTTPATQGTPDTTAVAQNITVLIRPDYTIVVDGVARTFRDVDGKMVDPLLYEGSIYLPLRAIGEMMGMNVEWDATDGTVFLSGEVTDYDTNYSTGGNTGTTTGAAISMSRAREIALANAGLTADDVVFVECELGSDDGRLEYEIEFIRRTGSGYTEYDYEIDANTGAIRGMDRDAEHFHGSQTAASVTADRARQIALAEVPGATAANIRSFDMDSDDGRLEYEVTIWYNSTEYEFTIDASTGRITERETDREDGWDDDRYDDDWDDRYDDDWDDRYDDDWDDRYDDDWDDRYDDDDWDDRYDDDDWDDRWDD